MLDFFSSGATASILIKSGITSCARQLFTNIQPGYSGFQQLGDWWCTGAVCVGICCVGIHVTSSSFISSMYVLYMSKCKQTCLHRINAHFKKVYILNGNPFDLFSQCEIHHVGPSLWVQASSRCG